MADVLTAEQRRLNMSRIRGRDTKPEILIRRGLHARGLRFRLHDHSLPGRPDLIFPKYRAAVFIHGCFWHAHQCYMFRLPATRPEFWANKIHANQVRDRKAHAALREQGWRILTVWECALRGTKRLPFEQVIDVCVEFIQGAEQTRVIENAMLSGLDHVSLP